MKSILFLLTFMISICITSSLFAQSITIDTVASYADSSAILDIKSNSKGILIPRLTYEQRVQISNPATGLLVYQIENFGFFKSGLYNFNGASWRNISENPGGKPVLVFSDSITNSEAQQKLLYEYGYNTHDIRIIDCINLTSIDLSAVSEIVDLTITNNPVLANVDLSNLVKCEGGYGIDIENCPSLTAINFSSLQKSLIWGSTGVGINIKNTKVINLSFPALFKTTTLRILNNPSLANLNFPNLSYAKAITIQGNNTLTSLALPNLISTSDSTYGFSINFNPNLTSLTFDNLSSLNGGLGINLNGNKFNSIQINYLLNKIVSLNPLVTNRNISLKQTISAPPIGQGLMDKTTLIARGNNVSTD